MANLTSSLRIVLIDDVTKAARSVDQALHKLENDAKGLAKAFSGTNAPQKFLQDLSKIGLKAGEIDKVAKAFRNFAAAEGLAAKSADQWTRAEKGKFGAWSSSTIKELKKVAREQAAYNKVARQSYGMGWHPGLDMSRMSKSHIDKLQDYGRAEAKARQRQDIAERMSRHGMGIDVDVPLDAGGAKKRGLLSRLRGAGGEGGLFGAAELGAAGGLMSKLSFGHVAGTYLAYKGLHDIGENYREFDKERRYAKAVMEISDQEQQPLIGQAIHLGSKSRYNDIQVLEAQRELASRGLKRDQIMGMMESATHLGQAFDLTLPEAVRQMEGAVFGFQKPIATLQQAVQSAKQTADAQVKAAKISGMNPEDIMLAYKYGASPAKMSGMSEESLLGWAGVLKKANMGGDEAGVAFRAMVGAGMSPTRRAREAMAEAGIDYESMRKMPDKLPVEPFVKQVAQQYGVKLGKGAQDAVGKIFESRDLINAPEKFTPAILKALEGNMGKQDLRSKKTIAGLANRFRDAAAQQIDMNGFVDALAKAMSEGHTGLANAVFGTRQGGRIAQVLREKNTYEEFKSLTGEKSEGYAARISEERMAGFDGAVYRFDGAIKNLESALGRLVDEPLTKMTDFLARTMQSAAEALSPKEKSTGPGSYENYEKIHGLDKTFGPATPRATMFQELNATRVGPMGATGAVAGMSSKTSLPQFAKIQGAQPLGSMSDLGTAKAHIDASEAAAAKQMIGEVKSALDTVGSTTATPQVSTAGLTAADALLSSIQGKLAAISGGFGAVVAGAQRAAAAVNSIPSSPRVPAFASGQLPSMATKSSSNYAASGDPVKK